MAQKSGRLWPRVLIVQKVHSTAIECASYGTAFGDPAARDCTDRPQLENHHGQQEHDLPLLRRHGLGRRAVLGACRAWGVDSEKRPQRGQFLPDLQAHSPAMGQKAGKKWTAEAVSQPTIPKSDRLMRNKIKERILHNQK